EGSRGSHPPRKSLRHLVLAAVNLGVNLGFRGSLRARGSPTLTATSAEQASDRRVIPPEQVHERAAFGESPGGSPAPNLARAGPGSGDTPARRSGTDDRLVFAPSPAISP